MKKIIRNMGAIALFTLSSIAYGQVSKGTLMLGGSASGDYRNEDLPDDFAVKNGSISLSPILGYFVTDRIALGSGVDLSYSFGELSQNEEQQSEFSSVAFGLLPFVRYYPVAGLFTEMRGGVESTNINQTGINNIPDSQDETYSVFAYTLEPGIGYNYFLNEQIALEGRCSYRFENQNTSGLSLDQETTRNSLQLSIGLQVFLRNAD